MNFNGENRHISSNDCYIYAQARCVFVHVSLTQQDSLRRVLGPVVESQSQRRE